MEIARKDVFAVSFFVVLCLLSAYPDNPYGTYRMVVLSGVVAIGFLIWRPAARYSD